MRRLVGRPAALGLAFVALALVPAVANPYLVYVTCIALLYVILAVGLNVLLGYAGQFAFANAALFGIGAYATGLAQLKLGWSFWLALPAGAVFTALAGLLVALPALRLSGLYLARAAVFVTGGLPLCDVARRGTSECRDCDGRRAAFSRAFPG